MLQPIVAVRQQPIGAAAPGTLWGVKKTGKERAIGEFSRRLNEFIEKRYHVAPDRRQKWLHKTVSEDARKEIRIEVKRTSVQNWLRGLKAPDTAHVMLLCEILGCNPNWLLTGFGPMMPDSPDDPEPIDLLWEQLDVGNRAKVIDYADLLRKNQPHDREPPGLEDRQVSKS